MKSINFTTRWRALPPSDAPPGPATTRPLESVYPRKTKETLPETLHTGQSPSQRGCNVKTASKKRRWNTVSRPWILRANLVTTPMGAGEVPNRPSSLCLVALTVPPPSLPQEADDQAVLFLIGPDVDQPAADAARITDGVVTEALGPPLVASSFRTLQRVPLDRGDGLILLGKMSAPVAPLRLLIDQAQKYFTIVVR